MIINWQELQRKPSVLFMAIKTKKYNDVLWPHWLFSKSWNNESTRIYNFCCCIDKVCRCTELLIFVWFKFKDFSCSVVFAFPLIGSPWTNNFKKIEGDFSFLNGLKWQYLQANAVPISLYLSHWNYWINRVYTNHFNLPFDICVIISHIDHFIYKWDNSVLIFACPICYIVTIIK